MVVKGMDETPVLPESEQQLSNKHGDSQIQSFSLRALNASTSSPGISTESSEDPSHLAGHTGPIHYEKRTVFSPMNQGREVHKLVELGLTERRYPSFIPEGQSEWHKDIPIAKDAHLLRSGELGMCNDPYCRTCPIYYRKVASQRTSSTSKHPFHHSLYRNAARGWATRFSSCIGHHIPGVLNPHAKFVQHWNRFFFMSCLIAVFVDPLFFFLQSVKLNEMCVAYNLPMTITVVILRTMTDVIFLLHILLQFRLAYVDPQSGVFGARYLVDESKKIALNYLHGHFSVDLFTALPLPQIMILLVLPQIPQSILGDTMKNLSLTAVLAPRIFKFLPLLAGRSPTGFIFESAWVNFVINLLTFVLSGHVIGSCWYLFGLQRVTRCLRQACNTTASCMDVGCINYSKLSKPLPENWKMNVNASYCFQEDDFYYGIYRSAVNLTTQDRVVTRYMYSLFWGFQQISTLAGNLIPGYFLWEIIFTMAIIGLGLFLFALLIGNMQNFLQSLGRRRLEMSIRSHDADQWMSRMRIPEELKRRVFEAERYNWAMTEGINQEKILENLPEDLQIDIRRHLFKFLQKVRIFELLDDPVLDAIYGKLRQRTFITGSKILNRDGIIERIIFIVRGRLQSVGEEGISDLSEGDVCGEELLEWCLHNYLRNKGGKRFKVPMMHSSRSVKCLTNVEAFTLELADLEELTMRFARLLRSPRVVKALRSASPYLKSYVVTPTEGARREKRKCIPRRRTPVTIASLQWRR